ncbi:colicin immunity domain-containing protein [Streptomyces sp. NPDC059002]|uniref:colicin immunity domain-containing protein n=1 Tax=Streptomyces sp. NPDC059002 TaxID=3346690 RepID=UPI0036B7F930
MSKEGNSRMGRDSGRGVRDVVSGTGSFRREWLAASDKSVVPVPSPSGMDKHLARRVSSGAAQAGHDHVIACRVEEAGVAEPGIEIAATQESILRETPWNDGEFLIVLPDLAGALLVTDQGYALIAGEGDFLRGGIPEGVDQATVDFSRYAKRVGRSHPAVLAVAAQARPVQVAWASKSDVAEGSATAQQMALMESFAADDIGGEEFAVAWLDARRQSLHLRERLREPFSRILDQVFYALDDYVIDPGLRDADDMTNEQLQAQVRESLADLDALERRP